MKFRAKPMKQEQVDQWNSFYPDGSPCTLILDDGTEMETHTRSQAWLIGGGFPVVLVVGKTGGFHLDRVKMHETHKEALNHE